MQQQVYHSRDIQAWEQRWFSAQNSAYGLMQQVAWCMTQQLERIFSSSRLNIQKIALWCGPGNNAGDGYCIAGFLKQRGYVVEIFAAQVGESPVLNCAIESARLHELLMHSGFQPQQQFDCHIDALFGIGLNRALDTQWQQVIHHFNNQSGLKIAIDLPSGLHADTGQVLTCAIRADWTLTALGLKAGLLTGQGREYAGQLRVISLIPVDAELKVLARVSPVQMDLPVRQATGHKGNYGHVLIVGGHASMGGAAILAAESAFSAGAGKVTVVCHEKHHAAILARAPNIMIRDMNTMTTADMQDLIRQANAVSFGMGLGRDSWSEQQFLKWFPALNAAQHVQLVLDADALWWLALHPVRLKQQTYVTPHPGEAAKLLHISVSEVESDRISAIHQLQQSYAGQWVLKGAGSLTLEDELWICTAGNAGMATAGMGDVLAGMLAGLKAQFQDQIHLHEIVSLHALAGDVLARQGMRGLQAQQMIEAVYRVVNQGGDVHQGHLS
ncbi:NAD(P)H-hydrate dehydratase [Acinetobacter sp. WZC-1]|uniref:NAD(P)H-hydrate dehydratase n=1 Tax=Acinetobacter sp. WZC-1 TaxID=3459034 RepID=UPI00403DE5FB